MDVNTIPHAPSYHSERWSGGVCLLKTHDECSPHECDAAYEDHYSCEASECEWKKDTYLSHDEYYGV